MAALEAEDLLARFEVLGRRFRLAEGDGLNRLPGAALATVSAAGTASVTIMQGRRFRSVAPTDDRASQADQLQYTLGSGPCVDTMVEGGYLNAPADLANDERWPKFGPAVVEQLGLASMLSFRLAADVDGVAASLNLYAGEPRAFDDDDLLTGTLLATHGTAALVADLSRHRAEQLSRALQSNREIGVAIGILMQQRKLTRSAAFDLLRIASQHTNRKLHDIAVEVGDTGALPFPSH
jgi:hypothetical protein